MKRAEVFTPTTLPGVTFVEDHLVEKRRTLLQALEMGGKRQLGPSHRCWSHDGGRIVEAGIRHHWDAHSVESHGNQVIRSCCWDES